MLCVCVSSVFVVCYCLLLVVNCPLLAVRWSLFVVCCLLCDCALVCVLLLFGVACSLFVVGCLVFVVA